MYISLCKQDGPYSDRERTHRCISRNARFIVTLGIVVSIMSPGAAATTFHVPGDAPTIQAAIDMAESGDDVLVAPGEYFEHDITLKGGVWVHTEQGPEVTIIDAEDLGRGFYGSALGEVATLEGFTIRNGIAGDWGGGVGIFGSSFSIRNSIITDCQATGGGGIYARGSALEVSGCQVMNCFATGGGGIYLEVFEVASIIGCEVIGNIAGMGPGGGIVAGSVAGTLTIAESVVSENQAIDGPGGGIVCMSPDLLIRDCLVTQNTTEGGWGGAAIEVEDSHGEIVGCTVSNTMGSCGDGDGLAVSSEMSVANTIISFNAGRGVTCAPQVTFHCNDVYGNAEGDDLCGEDLGGNFSEDPLFCDPENGDYTLDACSPCLPGNHPHGVDCGLIGALGQGCGATPVEETSWGRIKSLYR